MRRPKGILVNKRSDNGRLGDIGGGDRNLIITFDQIKLGENSGAMETSRKIMEIRERIAVWNSLKIETAAVVIHRAV